VGLSIRGPVVSGQNAFHLHRCVSPLDTHLHLTGGTVGAHWRDKKNPRNPSHPLASHAPPLLFFLPCAPPPRPLPRLHVAGRPHAARPPPAARPSTARPHQHWRRPPRGAPPLEIDEEEGWRHHHCGRRHEAADARSSAAAEVAPSFPIPSPNPVRQSRGSSSPSSPIPSPISPLITFPHLFPNPREWRTPVMRGE
jgi:hypothetical protein